MKTTSTSAPLSSTASAPPGRAADGFAIAFARSACSVRPRCSSRSMLLRRRSAEKLPPSGKISTASFGPRSRLMAAISTPMSPPRESMKRFGEAVAEHVDQRVQRERLVHDDPRVAPVAAQQQVEHEQGVALAGVDAERHDRPLARGQHGLGRRRVLDLHAHARHPQRRRGDRADEVAHDPA
jgi:hypothetical protein